MSAFLYGYGNTVQILIMKTSSFSIDLVFSLIQNMGDMSLLLFLLLQMHIIGTLSPTDTSSRDTGRFMVDE